ncbi:MAG: NADP-dependent oxidoreductase [Bacteroidota bacterium]
MNTQVILKERPTGIPNENTWSIEKNAIPSPSDGEVLIKILYISLDPAMRGWMDDTKSYLPPVPIGAVMRALVVGEVIESKHSQFKKGDHLQGVGGVQEYVVTDGKGWHQIDPNLAPLPMYLGVLGMTGMTAYFGLLDVGKPKEGEAILVSGAAGAVGALVGQIGKVKGCRVVGIAGGKEKCDYIVNELGFDAAIDYKNENVYKGIKEHCPDGVDVYFDNVGGDILDMALACINLRARIVICGAISQYNDRANLKGPKNYLSLLINRARMEGFVILDYAKEYRNAAQELAMWVMAGKMKEQQHIEEGIENFLPTFLRLFSGEKKGKLILKP